MMMSFLVPFVIFLSSSFVVASIVFSFREKRFQQVMAKSPKGKS